MNLFQAAFNARGARRSTAFLPPGTLATFVITVVAILIIAALSYQSLQTRGETANRVIHTYDVIMQTQSLLSSVKEAETAQRGFVITAREPYLDPYMNAKTALPDKFKILRSLTSNNPVQLQRIDILDQLVNEKLAEMARTIALRRADNAQASYEVVLTDQGKSLMDRIQTVVGDIDRSERSLLTFQQQEWVKATNLSFLISGGGSVVLLLLIAAVATMASRDYRARGMQSWVRAGHGLLGERMQGDQCLDRLGEGVLEFLADYLDAQIGALYIAEDGDLFRRVAGYALSPNLNGEVLRGGDGLMGQAIKQKHALHVRNVPEGYMTVASSLGRGGTRELLLAPARVDGVVNAVIELGFFRSVDRWDQELLAAVSESLGVAVRASRDRSRLEELLAETIRQGEELQANQEELRNSNEELEERERVLTESQTRLQIQHAELEQSNLKLELQAQLLGRQKDDLSRAKVLLTSKATELERSNQFKSEFLANMSHELRTPLNSLLILSELLVGNDGGNLTEEQVNFAQTISSAGNDLLTLIDDILDLAKIESGQVDVNIESVQTVSMIGALGKTFEPLAKQKSLSFKVSVDAGVPEEIETDFQRLSQILKNLLSNAFKFTADGEVMLRVCPGVDGTLSFAVCDTGIGLPDDQHEVIFEPFRQADGSTHRKYGGTGLGLSISRDLARLLGGDIRVMSRPGEGSTFTLTLPLIYSVASNQAASAAAATLSAAPPLTAPMDSPIDDDRDRLSPGARLVLVLEDDVRFAAILRDLAREMSFQCIVVHTAQEGLLAAAQYRPSAILLDMDLPDFSGLGVLDQLKRNPDTRHVLVHVVSVADYTQEALELGAIGYALKPVKREQLVDTFRLLQQKLSQTLRRVLVVENDLRQRESIRLLLETDDVRITAVDSVDAALRGMGEIAFDCMVLDLNLPVRSGYELLEKMAEQDQVSFPPVIVYTGCALSREEEQKLRRFSKSIIVKGARSPERLLDEVTLFLHQVESELPIERQRMLKAARHRDAALEGRRILLVEDDIRNIFALTSVLEPKGAKVEIARNGLEAISALTRSSGAAMGEIDLVLMDIMMPEMDGLTAMREIRKRTEWTKLPIIALTAKAMKDDHEKSLAAGANDYITKPLDVEKLLSLIRVWMPK